jgi:hypothetical protein
MIIEANNHDQLNEALHPWQGLWAGYYYILSPNYVLDVFALP